MNNFQQDKWYDHIYEVSSFDDLSEQIKKDLLSWYNVIKKNKEILWKSRLKRIVIINAVMENPGLQK
jgi:predicted transcriptional regulator